MVQSCHQPLLYCLVMCIRLPLHWYEVSSHNRGASLLDRAQPFRRERGAEDQFHGMVVLPKYMRPEMAHVLT